MLTVYGVPISVHARKSIVTAIHKGLDLRIEPVLPFNPPANWSDLSPTGMIPAMKDGDYILAESTAICFYMERKKPTPAVLPSDDKELGRVLFYDGYGEHLFRSLIHGLFVQKVISPKVLGKPADQSVIDNLIATVQPKLFDYLEKQAGKPFLVGNSLSLADIAIASNLISYQYLGFAISEKTHPQLARYVSAILALDPFKEALANEKPFAEQMGFNRDFID